MTESTTSANLKKYTLKQYVLVAGVVLLSLVVYIGVFYKQIIPISVIALIAGLIFESRRLAGNWKTIGLQMLLSFAISVVWYLDLTQKQEYSLENYFASLPNIFVPLFIVIFIITHRGKAISKVTEGITLLQSVAIIYWVIDYGFTDTNNLFVKSLMIIGLLFSLYSLFHAFSNTILSNTSRLTLSIWSSIIMMIFAIDNIYRIYLNEQIVNTTDIATQVYTALQYFLLGISSFYIVRNFFMLTGFLPRRGEFFNAEYYHKLKKLKGDHINRYSDKQVHILHSLFCILVTGIFFSLNYYLQILPRHIAIWTAFLVFPFIFNALRACDRKEKL